MRYLNWDVLVFPGAPDQCKIPLQEFKTACTVIQDQETHSFQSSPHLLPTVTSFIPALTPGSPFRISIHCWQNPDLSRYIQDIKKSTDSVVFEARLFIDGSIVGSRWFHQNGPWPTVIEMSINVDKNGEFEKLKFPEFHKELLSQSYWNAGDVFGRIKLVISEGFAREHLAYPYERVKNVAAFSFQHAPLDVLEQSNIAWPNQAMWRQVSLVGTYIAQQHSSPRKTSHEEEVHSHSPRRGSQPSRSHSTKPLSSMVSSCFSKPVTSSDPFTDPVHTAFSGWRQSSAIDISMPDYSSSGGYSRPPQSRQITDPMSITGVESMAADHNTELYCDGVGTRPPANTPQHDETIKAPPLDVATTDDYSRKPSSRRGLVTRDSLEMMGLSNSGDEEPDHAGNTAEAFTVQRVPGNYGPIKSRKELAHQSPTSLPESSTAEENLRNISQTLAAVSNVNNKRQRVPTPAASKAIDDEDEPRSSPTARKVSRTNNKETQAQKRVLTNITNNV